MDHDDLRLRAAIHDANQLLWVIVGQARLWERRAGDAAARDAAARIAATALDVATVLRPLLGAPPPEREVVIGDAGACDVAAELRSVFARCAEAAAGQGGHPPAGHELVVADGPRPLVAAAALDVRRILGNLVSNALDAMPAGGRVTARIAAGDDRVVLELADEGPGLPDVVAREPFAGGTTSKAHGHGIGLAGCRALARDLGGDLELAAARAPGAVWRLILPAARARRLAVLAVDDESSVREMLAEWLADEGHAVVTAADRDEALRALAERDFDVVLVDVRLAWQSGREVAAEIRRRDPAVALIAMSGWGPPEEGPAAPHDFAVVKPLDVAALTPLLDRAARLTARRRRA